MEVNKFNGLMKRMAVKADLDNSHLTNPKTNDSNIE